MKAINNALSRVGWKPVVAPGVAGSGPLAATSSILQLLKITLDHKKIMTLQKKKFAQNLFSDLRTEMKKKLIWPHYNKLINEIIKGKN